MNGYVYLMRREPGLTKIGCSKDPRERIKSLEPGSELVHTIETNDMHRLERELHKRYEQFHQRAEWFELSGNEVTSLTRIARVFYTAGLSDADKAMFELVKHGYPNGPHERYVQWRRCGETGWSKWSIRYYRDDTGHKRQRRKYLGYVSDDFLERMDSLPQEGTA